AVPFGTSTTFVSITAAIANGDTNFRARRLAIDGTTMAVANFPWVTDTNKIVVYSIAAGAPVRTQTITAPSNTRDLVLRNNALYVAAAGSALYAYDLSTNPATVKTVNPSCTDSTGVAVDGAYLYL